MYAGIKLDPQATDAISQPQDGFHTGSDKSMEQNDRAILQIAICDDEPAAATLIADTVQQILEARGIRHHCDRFTQSRMLEEKLQSKTRYDVLFTDIDMPQLDGIALALQHKEALANTILVFVSGREDLVFDTFQAEPFRFVRKESLATSLPKIVVEAWDEYQRRQGQKMVFRSGTDTILLRPEKILYLESILKTQVLHTSDRAYELQSSLQKLMGQLQGHGFVQIHKSYFVNCRYIAAVNRTTLTLDDGTTLPVGRAFLRQTQKAFQVFVLNSSEI